MRKKYAAWAWMCLTALWAGGCTEAEHGGGQAQSNHPVVFITGVTTDGTTRGELINDFPDGAAVGLYGYCCLENGDYGRIDWNAKKAHLTTPDKNLFDNTSMTLSGNVWTYEDGLRYWYADKEYLYAFFAYYPHDAQDSWDARIQWEKSSAGDPVLTYTMPFSAGGNTTDELSQENVQDVLYASSIDWKNVSNTPVTLNFQHLMTGLEFEIENHTEADVYIEKMSLQGEFRRSASVTLPGTVKAGSDTYSGQFPVITGQTVYDNKEENQPQKVKDGEDNLVELMLLADYEQESIGENIQVSISYGLGSANYTSKTFAVPVSEMDFEPGVKNIIRLTFIGNHIILSFQPGSAWTLGGDDDIVFE